MKANISYILLLFELKVRNYQRQKLDLLHDLRLYAHLFIRKSACLNIFLSKEANKIKLSKLFERILIIIFYPAIVLNL